jgi:thiol-disulfide isomerase/thioredoxin
VRVLACFILIGFGLGLAGCTSLGKNSQSAQAPPQGRPYAGSSIAPPAAGGMQYGDRATSAGINGVLAGRVLDSYDHVPPPTFIRILQGDAHGPKGEPIEVATDSLGFFMIRDLQPGQHYQLIARTRDGGPRLAGTTWATPPNPRVLIYMSQDLATNNTPPPPGPPAIPGQRDSGQSPNSGSESGSANAGKEQSKPSTSSIPQQGGAELGPPVRIDNIHPSRSDPRMEVRPQDTAQAEQGFARGPLQADINPQYGGGFVAESTDASSLPNVATRVPSCVLTGKQLDNFALYGLDGKTWEYRTCRRGKVVLLDFWGTWCLPCREAVHHLRILQSNYGPLGLEVIGIDYEQTGTPQQQIRRVQNVRDVLHINYRLLLGSDIYNCPVKAQFGIRNFPTLVLLDENSRIIWRAEGLDGDKLLELEVLIKQHLMPR